MGQNTLLMHGGQLVLFGVAFLFECLYRSLKYNPTFIVCVPHSWSVAHIYSREQTDWPSQTLQKRGSRFECIETVLLTWNRAVIRCLKLWAAFGSAKRISWYFSSKSDQSFITRVTFSRCVSSKRCWASWNEWVLNGYLTSASLCYLKNVAYFVALVFGSWIEVCEIWIDDWRCAGTVRFWCCACCCCVLGILCAIWIE